MRVLAGVSAAVVLAGCTGAHAITRSERVAATGVTWFAPALASDRLDLARWSAAVGPAVVQTRRDPTELPVDILTVVSWNTAVGSADVARFLRELRSTSRSEPLVLLLQEVYRRGPEVPRAVLDGIRFAGRLGGDAAHRREIESIAESEGLNLYYVPSMRNGSPLVSDEDRGNAILATLPLGSLSAIELPFERQRRVALSATLSGRTSTGASWNLRVVSTHLDNVVGVRRGWILGAELARTRQARALVDALRNEHAVIVGGDFNTWAGYDERAYKELALAFPDTDAGDRRPTFMGLLRLDHVFLRLPDGWSGRVRRAADSYGSDHYPLIATIDLRGRAPLP